jgi:hypothetical protein
MALHDGFPSASGLADANDVRLGLAGLILRDTSGAPRTGVFPRSTTALASSTATMNTSVAAFEAVLGRTGQGAIFIANDAATNVLHPNAPVSNSRYDIVYVKQNDAVSPNADADSLPVFGVLAGTPSASPTLPTYATAKAALAAGAPGAGAEPVAAVLIPSTATTTSSGGVVYTQLYRYTCATGGVLTVRNSSELPTSVYLAGQKALAQDTQAVYRFDGSSWVLWNKPWASFTPTLSNFTSATTPATITGSYAVVEGVCHLIVQAKLGTGTITVGDVQLTLPVAAVTTGWITASTLLAGVCGLNDVSSSGEWPGFMRYVNSTTVQCIRALTSPAGSFGAINSTNPFTWQVQDELSIAMSYRVA